MSFVHLRYKKEMTESLIKPGHKRITILRDPIKQFKSTWKYYNAMLKGFRQNLPSYDEDNPDFIAEITDFLKRPGSYISGLSYASPEYQFVKNPQFVFFGFPRFRLILSFRTINCIEVLIRSGHYAVEY